MRNSVWGLASLLAVATACNGSNSLLADGRGALDASNSADAGSSIDARELSPYTAPILLAGTFTQSTWLGSAASGRVRLVLVAPDNSETVVVSDVPDIGATSWQVPLLPVGNGYRIEVRDATLNTVVEVITNNMTSAAMASITWNSALSVEEYGWLDLATGSVTTKGTVGDLQTWQGGAAFDAASSKLYVIGNSDVLKLYTLDTRTGDLLASIPLVGGSASGLQVNSAGELLGFQMGSGTMNLVVIDPIAGTVTPRGAVPGTSLGWQGEGAIDRTANRVYVLVSEFGVDPAIPWLHVLDATTGALISSSQVMLNGGALSNLLGLQVSTNGALVACRWSGTAQQVVRLDPATGTATVIGQVGDLQTWQGKTAIDPTTGAYFVFGNGEGDAPHLYVINGETGQLLDRSGIAALPAAALVVY